jgi:diguanylate cyclase (GGDEF)-like protein
VVTAEGEETVPAARQARTGNRLGAGDALAASVIYHLLLGAPPVEAARASMGFALEVAESAVCNSASGNPLERAITDYRRQAFVDTLTGLPNRSAGLRRVAEVVEEGKRKALESGTRAKAALSKPYCAVAIIDVDKFKAVNDTFGHDAGDEALKLVAQAMGAALRRGDYGCRWGGEEFVCFIAAKDADEARSAAERIRGKISDIQWSKRKLTASIGVALWFPKGSFEDAVASADRALYAAKEGGRNRVVLDGEQVEVVT